MNSNINFKLLEIDVIILCGGIGSRLRPIIADTQKVLAPIDGKPFLDIIVENLLKQGFMRIIFCVGYKKEKIIERYSNRTEANYLFSEEDFPLGTGGAIINALSMVKSNNYFVLNGDSSCSINFQEFYRFHLEKKAAISLVIAATNTRADGGSVVINESYQIINFMEKSLVNINESFINAGIYLIDINSIKFEIIKPPFSLEYDMLPILVSSIPCYGFVTNSQLIDIGTPERYLKANTNYFN
jgi:NDP-sugar pyrophosphorylase family protein